MSIACSPPDGGADADADTAEDTGDEMEEVGGDLPEDFTFDSEYEMRFTEFEFTDDSPGTIANSIIDMYLDQSRDYPIVVLLHLKEIAPSEGTAMLRGGAGLKVDMKCVPQEGEPCKYEWDPNSNQQGGGVGGGMINNCGNSIGDGVYPGDTGTGGDMDAGDAGTNPDAGPSDAGGTDTGGNGTESKYTEIQLDAETGELRGGLDRLDFVGTTEFEDGSIRKFTLPIHEIVFKQAFIRPTEEGEVEIAQGKIRGYITEEAAKTTKVTTAPGSEGVPIADLLEDDPNYDRNDDGVRDSWCMEARFNASEATIVEN